MTVFKITPDAPKVFTETFKIRSYHTDISQKLTIPKLCSFFQDIAGEHTVACGVGWDVLNDANLFWVLSRMKIEVKEMPTWEEEVTIETWSNGLDGIMAIRHFQVLNRNGEKLVKAISSWLLLDIKSRRITRPNQFMSDFPFHDKWLFEEAPERISKAKQLEVQNVSNVAFTEMDMNQHMNNVSYIERILNTYDYEFLLENEIAEFEINFLKEAKIHDEISVLLDTSVNPNLAEIVTSDQKTEFIRASIKWQKR